MDFDLIVIGGGPAGMMSAISAGQNGARVLLLEKNTTLGKKLLMTGGERCNFTKAEFDVKKLAKSYGKEGDFLLSAFTVFGPKEIIEFFENGGLKTKVENDKKAFPQNNSAKSVLDVLEKSLKENKVEVLTEATVAKINKKENKIFDVELEGGRKFSAKNFVICAGGMSYHLTGSSGDSYKFAKELGHKIKKPRPALSPIKTKENWVEDCQGISLRSIEARAFAKNGKLIGEEFGDVVFTHFGISGPAILNLSSKISETLEKEDVALYLDLLPQTNRQEAEKQIGVLVSNNPAMAIKNILSKIVPQKMGEQLIKLAGIDLDKKSNNVSKKERRLLADLIKKLPLTAVSLMGFEQAIATLGGVDLREVDAKTMRSKIVENLFFAGEAINLHGPTGGYNLQLCWSTGFLAGKTAKI